MPRSLDSRVFALEKDMRELRAELRKVKASAAHKIGKNVVKMYEGGTIKTRLLEGYAGGPSCTCDEHAIAPGCPIHARKPLYPIHGRRTNED